MKYGRVIDATLMMDKDTGRPRGFGFVTFDGEDAVDRTLMQPLAIHGKQIEVKRAEPRGNVQEERGGGKFQKRGRGDQHGSYDGGQEQYQGGGGGNGGGQGGQGGAQNTNGMSQAQMAAYWFKMQAYFRNMQQNIISAQPQMPAGMGGMNPAMMQQMGMNPAMMAQMQGQQGPGPMSPGMQSGMQSPGGSYGGQMMGQNPAGQPAFTPQDQLAFEQSKYERQTMARMQHVGYNQGNMYENMYDDGAPPPMGPGGGGNRGFGGRGNRRGGGNKLDGGRGGGGAGQTPDAPPINAPTGPKSQQTRPGGNYRGGRGRGNNSGFRPY